MIKEGHFCPHSPKLKDVHEDNKKRNFIANDEIYQIRILEISVLRVIKELCVIIFTFYVITRVMPKRKVQPFVHRYSMPSFVEIGRET